MIPKQLNSNDFTPPINSFYSPVDRDYLKWLHGLLHRCLN